MIKKLRRWLLIDGSKGRAGRARTNLVLDGPDGAVVPPVEVVGEAVGGSHWRLVRRVPELPLERAPRLAEAEVGAAELGGCEVGELGDAVLCGGVQQLVAARAEEIGLEDGQAVGVLVGVTVRLAEPAQEAREVVLRVQLQVVVVAAADHLTDQGVLDVHDGGRRRRQGGEEEGEEEAMSHRRFLAFSPLHVGDWFGSGFLVLSTNQFLSL
jgi:hypothetical protein